MPVRMCYEGTTHPFEVSVNKIEAVHIPQTVCDVDQLPDSVS